MILPKDISFIFDQLDDSDIFYWIDAGSLLKGVREHSLLTSSDIDIAIHADQVDNVLIFLEKIKNKGYKSIIVNKIPNIGIGIAINDRLKRASTK